MAVIHANVTFFILDCVTNRMKKMSCLKRVIFSCVLITVCGGSLCCVICGIHTALRALVYSKGGGGNFLDMPLR